ncbi:MAG: 3-deoxy-7-phosphoheptulonate synthase, partial [Anaerolineales bacterium]
MMIIMRTDATKEEIKEIVARVEDYGLSAHISTGIERTIIGAIGDGRPVHKEQFMHMPGV